MLFLALLIAILLQIPLLEMSLDFSVLYPKGHPSPFRFCFAIKQCIRFIEGFARTGSLSSFDSALAGFLIPQSFCIVQ